MPATTPPDATSAPPAAPQLIGHYQVLAKIGEGGMGVVYRARDTRLNREVAIKVLPRAFAEDPYRMARFEREAQLLASLNHPKIAVIYGLEEAGATRALVMELVEGPTLAERIGRTAASARASARPGAESASPAQASGSAGSGAKTTAGSGAKSGAKSGSGAGAGRKAAISLDEALPIAQQVAEALEYAHEHGVIHRDLKPANIKVTPEGEVKVLDFGLAKAMARDDASGDISNSPTLSLAMTEAGLIIGTAAYMAPEQAKGKQVDRRADVWAFGCVLYEMLAGQKAFEGETVSDVLASVIKSEPDWTALPAETPHSIQKLVRRCLAKDPKQRLHDIGDARLIIDEVLSGEDRDLEGAVIGRGTPEAGRISRLRGGLPWALGAAAMLFAGLAAYLMFKPAPQANVVRFTIPQPENTDFVNGGMTSISPDGRMLAFVAQGGEGKSPTLWLRRLSSTTAAPIEGTDGAILPFWSPDSQWIGFYANDKLEKVAVSGGAPQTICEAMRGGNGAAWNRDGVILFTNQRSLYRVPDTGGAPTLLLAPDPAHQAMAYGSPQFLPDGRHFLAEIFTPGTQPNVMGAGSLDSKTLEHFPQIISEVYYAAPGYLFYMDQGSLMARPFNARALRFSGPAVPVAQGIGQRSPGYGYFSVSAAGVLAYMTASNAIQNTPGQMTWLSRAGEKLGTVDQPDVYSGPAISADGTKLAVARGEQGKQDIWIYDLKRGAASRLTFNPADDANPSWSPDGSQILFSSTRSGRFGIYQKAADGLGSTQTVSQNENQARAIDDVSADGRYAIYDTANSSTTINLWALPLFGDRKPFAFVQGSFGAASARFSPNGRYVAYTSNESGKPEIYVETFPQPAGKWQISTSGGTEPMWRRDGKELFYLAPGDNASETKVMSVAVDSGSAAFQAGAPKELFQTQLIPFWYWRNIYVPSPDGQRFLMVTPAGQAKPQPITVVVNWPALLKK